MKKYMSIQVSIQVTIQVSIQVTIQVTSHTLHTPCPPYYFCQALTLHACYICYLIFLSSTYFYTYKPYITRLLRVVQ